MSRSFRLLIDGYNLMFQSLVSKQSLQASDALRLARHQMLQQLSELIEPNERQATCIVFDAKDAPRGLPDRAIYREMSVVFARDWESADAWMQDEIRRHPTPKKLTVVSSDHSIRQKAKARKAKIFDSEEWFEMQLDAFQRRSDDLPQQPDTSLNSQDSERKDQHVDSREELSRWLREFGFKDE